jgi:hypothetical protein
MSEADRQEQRERVAQKLRELGVVYEETGRDAADFITGAVGFLGDALVTLLWAVLAAVVGGAIFGAGGGAVGFVAVWIGVLVPRLGNFLLLLACSSVPGAFIALVLSAVVGGAFLGWWPLAIAAVIVYVWAKTVTAPVLPAPVEEPSPLGNARPASPSDIRSTDGIDYQ